jgi:hypothetical protein
MESGSERCIFPPDEGSRRGPSVVSRHAMAAYSSAICGQQVGEGDRSASHIETKRFSKPSITCESSGGSWERRLV